MSTALHQTAHFLRAFVVLAVLLAASGCKKVTDSLKPKLPDATQEGKNTFGCVLDGNIWLPYTDHTLDSKLECSYRTFSGGSRLMVRAERENDPLDYKEYVGLTLEKAADLVPGTYDLSQGFRATYSVSSGSDEYVTGPTSQGSITITKVQPSSTTGIGGITVRYTIVSGTFHFTATSAAGKTIDVKDGRFDVQAY